MGAHKSGLGRPLSFVAWRRQGGKAEGAQGRQWLAVKWALIGRLVVRSHRLDTRAGTERSECTALHWNAFGLHCTALQPTVLHCFASGRVLSAVRATSGQRLAKDWEPLGRLVWRAGAGG